MNRTFSDHDIDLLVRLVMKDLSEKGTAPYEQPQSKSDAADNGSAGKPGCRCGEVLSALCESPTIGAPSVNMVRPKTSVNPGQNERKQDDRVLTTNEKLITVQLIESKDDHRRKIWRIPFRAIVTPLAKDEFRKRGITVVCEESGSGSSPAKSFNFKKDKHGISPKSLETLKRPLILAIHEIQAESFLKGLIGRLEKSSSLTVVRKSCILETTAFLAEELQKSSSSAVLLTNYPSLAVMLSNRRRQVRALTAGSLDLLKDESKLIGPNLLVLDPRNTNVFQIQQMIGWFLEKGPFNPPKFIADALDRLI